MLAITPFQRPVCPISSICPTIFTRFSITRSLILFLLIAPRPPLHTCFSSASFFYSLMPGTFMESSVAV